MSFGPGHWRYRLPVLAIVLGAVAGYGYYALIGCHTGHCPLTSNPYIPTVMGAVLAGMATWPERPGDREEAPSGGEPDGAAGSEEAH